MYYEDERRKMVIFEEEIVRSFQKTNRLFDGRQDIDLPTKLQANDSIDRSLAGSFVSPPRSAFRPMDINSSDIENAVRVLATRRVLSICDRVSRDFVFELVDRSSVEYVGDRADHTAQLSWFWQDPHVAESCGFVHLEDILEVILSPNDESLFVVHLNETAKVLRSAKGRTSLTLRCLQAGERDKVVHALTYLLWAAKAVVSM